MFITKKRKENFCNLMALDYRVTYDQALHIYNLTKDKEKTKLICSKINTLQDYKDAITALTLSECDFDYIEQ